MVKTSPWWFLFALVLSVFFAVAAPSGELRAFFVVASPVLIGALVLLDNVILVRVKGSLRRRAGMEAATLLALSIALTWALHASATLAGMILALGLIESWDLYRRHTKW